MLVSDVIDNAVFNIESALRILGKDMEVAKMHLTIAHEQLDAVQDAFDEGLGPDSEMKAKP